MYNLTHTLCLNCFREETWKMSWSEFQQHKLSNNCCSNPRRVLMSGYEDGFYCKNSIFLSALEYMKQKMERWIKDSKMHTSMQMRIIDDLMNMGFIDSVYYDYIWGYNINYRWDDRTVISEYPL